jgi:hypothetical protein
MFRHFSIDPTPARIMREQAPRVYAWVARMWNARHSALGRAKWSASGGRLPRSWQPILGTIGQTYLPYLSAMSRAAAAGKRSFDVSIQGTTYRRLPVIPYRLWCRKRLQDHFEALPESARRKVTRTLREHGCDQLWDEGHGLQSAAFDQLPVCTPQPVGRLRRMYYYFAGTPWHRGIRNGR